MSRKNKTLRAFLHQNQSPTIEQAWDAAWKHAQKKFHARSMQDMEKQVADLQAECDALREALFEARATMTSALSFEPGINEVTKKALAAEIERIKSLLSEGGNKS